MFRFQSPYFLLLFLLLAILVFVREYRRRPASVVFSDVSLLRDLPKTLPQRLSVFVPWLLYLGVSLAIVALARPQSGKEDYRIRTEGIAIMMCIDRSGSMGAMDFLMDGHRVDRLEVVKKVFRDFVSGSGSLPGRPDDRIGLLAFGGYVDVSCPLTLDHATLLEMLEQVQLPRPAVDPRDPTFQRGVREEVLRIYNEESMTAIGDALAEAVLRLKEIKAKSKVIILLSDGEQTFGTLTPEEGAEAAKAFGIRIYSIGIGSNDWVPVPGSTTQPVFDDSALRRIAETTEGRYFYAKDTSALQRVYAEIDKLEKSEHEGRLYTRYAELYRGPLVIGMVLVFLYLLLVHTRLRCLP